MPIQHSHLFFGSEPPKLYAIWNDSDKSNNLILTNGGLTVTHTSGNNNFLPIRATIGKSVGKHCFEVGYTNVVDYGQIGFGDINFTLNTYLGASNLSAAYNTTENYIAYHSSSVTQADSTAPSMTTGPYMICIDAGAGKGWLILANVVASGGDPAAGTSPTWTWTPTTIYPAIAPYRDAQVMTANFGATPFSNTVPAGFNAGWYN